MGQYTLGPAPTSTLRTIPFTIPVSSWVLDNGVYTATFASAYITESSKEMCTFDESFRNYAKRDINVSKTSGGGSITLTTSVIPTGAVSGTIFTIDADDGKVCMVIEDTVLPISNGGTGANTLAGAKQNLGISRLENTAIRFKKNGAPSLRSFTTANDSWTATEDCVLIGRCQKADNVNALVIVDGDWLASGTVEGSGQAFQLFVKKGSIVSTRDTGGMYNFNAYPMS